MRILSLCLVISTLVLVTGCPKYKPPVDFNNPSSLVNKIDLNARLKSLQDQYWCYRFGFNYVGGSSNPCSGTVADGPAKAKALRNEFLETTIPFIDDAYVNYISDLQRGRDRENFVADLVELGTSAAIGFTNGERALKIMGIALTAFRGGRRSADLNFYKEQTTPILISKMDGNRANVRATILERERKEVDDYPIGAAISDIVDYYNAGTLVRAFTELAKDTAADARASEDNVKHLKGVAISRVATATEVADVKAALAVLRTLASSLASTDNAEKAAALEKLQAIVKALEAETDIAPLLKVADISSEDDNGTKLLNGLKSVKRKLPNDSPLQDKINKAIVANGR